MFGAADNDGVSFVRTFDITPTLEVIPDSVYGLDSSLAYDIAAGDLNGDDRMEQLGAWYGSQGHIWLYINQIPSQPPTTPSYCRRNDTHASGSNSPSRFQS